MVGKKFIAIIAGMVAFVAALAVAGLFFVDWQNTFAPQTAPQGPVVGESTPAAPAEPKAADEQKLHGEATGALNPPAEPTTVPTFDVVVIEPSGEGVIAGRAAPGWQVSVQSGGVKVAEAKADVQGEWSVVLEKPLPPGDHALSLKITSPDGTQAVSSQESVRVGVGVSETKANKPSGEAPTQAGPQASSPPQSNAAQSAPQSETLAPANVEPNSPRALTRAEQAALGAPSAGGEPVPPKQTLVFKTVDYQDTGSDTGVVTLTGTSNPGATIQIYYDDQPVAQARAGRDGTWRVAIMKKLGTGMHSFRAERIDVAGAPSGRAKIALERMEPKPKTPEVAAKEGPRVAAIEGAGGQTPGAEAQPNRESDQIYVIRRGDTLWAIAKRYLGSGFRYTSIFEGNRTIIQNPDLILPKQEVTLPKD